MNTITPKEKSHGGDKIDELKRSKYWLGFEEFNANDLASALVVSTSRARQILEDLRSDFDTIKPSGKGNASRGLRYKRVSQSKVLLGKSWVSSPTSDEFRPEWC